MTDRKRFEWWFSALCAFPWLVTGGVYLEASVVRLVLSRWPRPMFDDPKQLSTAPMHLVLQLLLMSLGIVIPLVIILAAWNWRKLFSDWRYTVCIGMFAAGLLAMWILSSYDPGHIWDWFVD
jgi:hypothetical protein